MIHFVAPVPVMAVMCASLSLAVRVGGAVLACRDGVTRGGEQTISTRTQHGQHAATTRPPRNQRTASTRRLAVRARAGVFACGQEVLQHSTKGANFLISMALPIR